MKSVLKKECLLLIRRLQSTDDAYYIIPKLKGAAASFSYGADEKLCDELDMRLKLSDYRIDEYGLCAFLRRYGASDRDVRRLCSYLTLIYCRRTAEGDENAVSLLRQADKLDYDKITEECSPLQKKLSLYEDYAISDDKTKEQYRLRLCRLARRRKCSALSVLSQIPQHKLTSTLFGQRSRSGLLHIILLFCFFILVCCTLFLLCGDPFSLLFAAVPFYRLSEFAAGKLLSRLLPSYSPARVNEDQPVPPCLTVTAAVLDGTFDKLCLNLQYMYFTEGKRADMYFGILADLPDNDKKYDKGDGDIISDAVKRIDLLNQKHGNRFYLFLRQRKYSWSERKFIAPDRKKGAVCELVRQMKTGQSSLEIYGADPSNITGIPYLITLDSDTLLFPGSSDSLLRCAVHPANRPKTDKKTARRYIGSRHFPAAHKAEAEKRSGHAFLQYLFRGFRNRLVFRRGF